MSPLFSVIEHMFLGCPMGEPCEKVLGKEAFLVWWLGLGDIKLQIKGGWARAMQCCVMQGHMNVAGGATAIPWNGASPLWSWRGFWSTKARPFCWPCSRPALGAFCYHKSKAWVMISRMGRDVTRHRPAKSFLTSCVTNKRRVVRYVAKAV